MVELKTGSKWVGYKFSASIDVATFVVGENKKQGDADTMEPVLRITFNSPKDIDDLVNNLQKLSKQLQYNQQLAICA